MRFSERFRDPITHNPAVNFRKLAVELKLEGEASDDSIKAMIIAGNLFIDNLKYAAKELLMAKVAINLLREFSEVIDIRDNLPRRVGKTLILLRGIYLELINLDPEQITDLPDITAQKITNLIIESTINT